MARRRSPTGWFDNVPARARFELAALRSFPDLRRRKAGRGADEVIVYTLSVTVPEYEGEHVLTIKVANLLRPHLVGVTVDGATESPHRYPDTGHLCMWHPDDPPELRWLEADGLLALIEHARLHLFREAYWRETDQWAGPEASHAPPKEEAA